MKENKRIGLCTILVIILIIIGVGVGCYLYKNNNKDTEINKIEKITEDTDNIIINDKKISKTDLKITGDGKIKSSKIVEKSSIAILSITEPTFQFDTYYLLCFDKDGAIIFDVRKLKDKDNDNNSYKYMGDFEYDETNKVLLFSAKLFLGESDESTGTAFNDKFISELSKDELNKLGNYSDVLKYEYKYQDKEFVFSKKTEISKLKNNTYYKDIFNK